MICSSRPGTQPANLQGIWNDQIDPPWGSKYTTNINLQMNYWLPDPANLGECMEPLIRLVEEVSATGAEMAAAHYGARGWVLHHNTDLWRAAGPDRRREVGPVADRRRLALRPALGPRRVPRPSRAAGAPPPSAHRWRGPLHLRRSGAAARDRLACDQSIALARERSPVRRFRVRRSGDGPTDRARPHRRAACRLGRARH